MGKKAGKECVPRSGRTPLFRDGRGAQKKADPNHLYLGSRLHGRGINEATITAAGACDVISINYYHRWEPEVDRMKAWEKWSGRPFFVSEFVP